MNPSNKNGETHMVYVQKANAALSSKKRSKQCICLRHDSFAVICQHRPKSPNRKGHLFPKVFPQEQAVIQSNHVVILEDTGALRSPSC